MEQIQIRQPKMPAAHSFIQGLLTFMLKKLFPFPKVISKVLSKNVFKKLIRTVAITTYFMDLNIIFNFSKVVDITKNYKFETFYYFLLTLQYISFSSHVINNLKYFFLKDSI